jgi:hypothetical protein
MSGVALWIGHFYFWFSYFNSSPKTPDPSSGHIVPLNNHGFVAYLTTQQDTRLTAMTIVAVVLFVSGATIYHSRVRSVSPKPWEKRKF